MGQRTGHEGDILSAVNCPDWHKIGVGETPYTELVTEPKGSKVSRDRGRFHYNDDTGDPASSDRKRRS